IAAADRRDAGADLLDDAGGLVPEHHRQGQGPVAVDDVPVAVADTGRHHAYPGFARLGALLLDVHHLERGVRLVQDRSFHHGTSGLARSRAPALFGGRSLVESAPVRKRAGATRDRGPARPAGEGEVARRVYGSAIGGRARCPKSNASRNTAARRSRSVRGSSPKRHSMSFRIDAWSHRPCATTRRFAYGLYDHASILKLIEWRFVMLDGTHRLRRNGQDINQLARLGTFAEHVVCPAEMLVPISTDMPWPQAALIGCAVPTGVGAVTRCAQVEAGASVVVIGCGGVGLNVIQGARLAGARMIIACDLLENKLAFAREFGATHTLNAKESDVAERVRKLTGGRGADYAFDAIGSEATTLQILDAIRPGGTAVIVGMAPMAARAP